MEKQLTLRKLCWQILGRYEQLPKHEQESFDRTYNKTMTVVRLTTDNFVTPKVGMRARLDDLNAALWNAILRERQRYDTRG